MASTGASDYSSTAHGQPSSPTASSTTTSGSFSGSGSLSGSGAVSSTDSAQAGTGSTFATDTNRTTSSATGETADAAASERDRTGITASTSTIPSTESTVADGTSRSSASTQPGTESSLVGGDIATRITEWRLSGTEIQTDLDRDATIVRSKESAVGAPTGSMDDSLLVTMVKGKLQADSQISGIAAKIDVVAHNGEVTLKGAVKSADQIGRAIALALNTEGVTKVSSEMKIDGATK